MASTTRRLLLGILQASAAWGTTFTHPSQVSCSKRYDFIVLGGGTAGLVLANRLSEVEEWNILVIEAGSSAAGTTAVDCPFLAGATLNSAVDWNYTTVPQVNLGNRSIGYNRGRMLGGSSGMNLLTFNRGAKDDFDLVARITKDDGWSSDNMEKYFKKAIALAPRPFDDGSVEPQHFGNGTVDVSLGAFQPTDFVSKIRSVTQELPDVFPFNEDLHGGNQVGTTTVLNFADEKSRRSYSAPAYLSPVQDRKNLDILVDTTITRLLANSGAHKTSSNVHFDGVEVAAERNGPCYTFRAAKELILSAGTIGSPQILMQSGVGDAKALTKLGIKPLLDLPGVGQNLVDQPAASIYYSVNLTATTFDDTVRSPGAEAAALQQWNTSGTGLFSSPQAATYTFRRLPADTDFIRQYGDPSSGPTAAHLEHIAVAGFAPPVLVPPTGNFMTLLNCVLTPTSSGSVTLNSSTDPFDHPVIDPAFLSTEFDRRLMVAGIRSMVQLASAPVWNGYIIAPLDGRYNANSTDEQVLEYLRENTVTIWHPVGTCAMAAADAPKGDGVVDNRLRVKGAQGLRVVDASVFPRMPAGHPTAPVYMFAERASDLIKEDWLKGYSA
ncbi:aryl-alcohol-oxidase from pleurotus Eryingii [Coniochaeta sp. 2T2.1]|nr:aryl-alcohol-oxidase from pleurotus Eryingii [Coniochaeta sp. 2T2.1]